MDVKIWNYPGSDRKYKIGIKIGRGRGIERGIEKGIGRGTGRGGRWSRVSVAAILPLGLYPGLPGGW